ncbi:DUF4917 family protein [Dyella sp. LX-66]|uniref:DUF4917 family protein n=1 Tax=unclassified Dyella TaxID=2634549 RepID=UPI001BDFD2DF|nr:MULTISPECIES: DUF4917 family protein [unclassified Dyella]MBT2119895.1 DUF4917 family protein [Dyella sp. LX-1]MBT2142397.1 DUF4917 family protein [Dyella sp. LX-66]
MALQTFEQALARVAPDGRPHLLMGNGFSRALRNDIFNYANLLDQADFGGRDETLRRLFDRLGTFDFEAVMRSLESTKMVLETYGRNEDLLAQVLEDQELLKSALITAISRTHPERPHDVESDQFIAVRQFLAGFNQVFTVNYDLLFYWARNQDELPPKGYTTDDGFRQGPVWREYGPRQDAHFLHGGLHIYEDGSSIRKLAHTSKEIPIIDQVRANLERGRFPLFVSEPTSEKKRRRIEHNPYLSYCYRALRRIDGALFILGHSMDANDNHIFNQIKESEVTQVFVSIHGDEHNDANTQTRAHASAFLESAVRTVEFFDAETAPVWN